MSRGVTDSLSADEPQREIARLRAELSDATARLHAAERARDRYRGEAEALRTSRTWRAATAVKWAVRNPRRAPRALRDLVAILRGTQ